MELTENARLTTPETAVLHSLRVKGRATESALATATGLSEVDISGALREGLGSGWYTQRTGRLAGWLLTPSGRDRWSELNAAERAAIDLGALSEVYDNEFLALNREFKDLCTRWQLAADASGLDRIDEALTRLLALFAAQLPRFARYRSRFSAALRRFTEGEEKALLQPLTDSYHDIWLELHEDLLLLLDKQRDPDD
ncbi:MAG TPA: hypothetical protein VG247_35140 [Pseudonocardiaceae bacterium]|nr:hypothetical protein [Pseudonocardiaceae bacterium]